MHQKSNNDLVDYRLYKQKRKVMRSGMWVALFIILLLFSVALYFLAPAFAGLGILFAILIVILTLGLILLNKEFRGIFGSGAEQIVEIVQKVSVILIITFSVLLVVSIVFYVLRRLKYKKMDAAQKAASDTNIIENTPVSKNEAQMINKASIIEGQEKDK